MSEDQEQLFRRVVAGAGGAAAAFVTSRAVTAVGFALGGPVGAIAATVVATVVSDQIHKELGKAA